MQVLFVWDVNFKLVKSTAIFLMLLVGKWVMQSSLRILDTALLRSISVFVENPNKHCLLSKRYIIATGVQAEKMLLM